MMNTFVVLFAVGITGSLAGYPGQFGYAGSSLFQNVHHGASIAHGRQSIAAPPNGDLIGMNSYEYGGIDGLSLAGYGGHGGDYIGQSGHGEGFLPASGHGGVVEGYDGLHGVQYGYGVPQRSKLYGGYVGGFGGYAKGALESIQHLNQGVVRPSYGHPKASFEHQIGLPNYGGQLSNLGGIHYDGDYKKKKSAKAAKAAS